MIISDLIGDWSEPARFDVRPVDDETIMKILDAARLAPSANNSQIWRFFVVHDRSLVKQAAALAGKPAFVGARTIIAACAQPWIVAKRSREQPFFMIDIPIAISHIILMAQELGIGTTVSLDFDESKLLGLIGAPKGYRAVAVIGLGYARRDGSGGKEMPEDVVRII